MKTPHISIVMPCYQCAQKLSRMVKSVIAQTFEDWELIAVDDGSTDGTHDVLLSLAETEPRMRVLRQENGGVSAARNAGIESSRGAWLAFVDADDSLPPDALQTLLALDDGQSDVLCGACEIVRGDERELFRCARGERQALLESLVRSDSALNHVFGKLYRACLIRGGGVRLPVGVAIGEDILFNLDVLMASDAWRVTDQNVYFYEVQPDSAMARAKRDGYASSEPFLNGIDSFIERNGLQTALFRAHIDVYQRTLRAQRGRLRAALAMGRGPARRVTRGVDARALDFKQRLYYRALCLCPPLSYFIP